MYSNKHHNLKKVENSIIKPARFVQLIFFLVIQGCSTNHILSLSDDNRIKAYSQYRFQKKYDLLQDGLLEEYQTKISSNLLIGRLYSIIDLADFYTYGFINYRKSLLLYNEAKVLNNKIKTLEYTGDTNDEESITYYQYFGNYVMPRKYDYSSISSEISSSISSINRILEYRTISENKVYWPAIKPLITDNYAFAIHVEKDLLSPDFFYEFEKELSLITNDYFSHRYKLKKSQLDYYINFNILHGLTAVFNFSSLSHDNIHTILRYIDKSRNTIIKESTQLEDAYLDFVNVLCLTKLGQHKKATLTFEKLQLKLHKINLELTKYFDKLKAAKNKAVAFEALVTIGYIALAASTIASIAASPAIISSIGFNSIGFNLGVIIVGISEIGDIATPSLRELRIIGESSYSKSIGILLDMNDQLQLFRAVGKSYHKVDNLENSIQFNKEAVNIIANLRSTISTEAERRSFAGYRDETYANLIDDLFGSKNYAEAFYYAENSRSRSLVDLLGSKGDLSFGKKNINTYVREIKDAQIYKDKIRGHIGITDQQVTYINKTENTLRNNPYGVSKNTITNNNLTKQKNQDKEYNEPFKPNEPFNELLTLVTVSNLDYLEIQKIIPDNTSLIEYYVTEKSIYFWVIDKNNFHSHSLDLNKVSVKKKVQQFIQNINSGWKGNSIELIANSKKLYEQFFRPIEKYIANKSVIVVGHGFLHYLPFEALYTGKEYLVEKYAFSYLPSASVIQFLEPIDTSDFNILVLGNPKLTQVSALPDLPGAEKESLNIASLSSNHKIFIGDKATETIFKKESHNYNISHIASHGLFNTNNAMESTLFLAPDQLNDGLLTSKEIYSIDKVSDLVVLSACETGQVEIGKGDELIGLTRSFFFSGASTLVASLWSVDDLGTQKLMQNFYTHMIKEKLLPKEALQKAKLDMIKSKKYRAPFYWAAFNMYGLGV